jgi:branched-chain amino acid transport system ATP-binding protein
VNSDSGAALLALEGVVAGYGSLTILKGISLTVARGEIVTLIGSNGAGKTTTLNTISGVVRAHRGRILFHGEDITARAPHDIARLGIAHVPEGRRLFPDLTVRENLEMGAFLRRDRGGVRADIERMFTMFPRLRERAHVRAGSLSGGEQQMCAIARGLMARPALLLLDEPSLGLAPIVVAQIFDIIRQINAEGTPVLLVEQNAHMALSIAHRGYVIATGEITLSGTGAQLLGNEMVKKLYLGEL